MAFLHVRGPDALLVDQLLRLAVDIVGVADVLGVGKLLVVVEEELAAAGGDRVRMGLDAEAEAGEVDVVDAVVPDIAGAEIVEPAPASVQQVGLIGAVGGRSEPEVVVEVGGRARRLLLADVRAEL